MFLFGLFLYIASCGFEKSKVTCLTFPKESFHYGFSLDGPGKLSLSIAEFPILLSGENINFKLPKERQLLI